MQILYWPELCLEKTHKVIILHKKQAERLLLAQYNADMGINACGWSGRRSPVPLHWQSIEKASMAFSTDSQV